MFFLILIIEVSIAKIFEWIADSGKEWLHTADEFQKRFVLAVDQLQPWRVYEIYFAEVDALTQEFLYSSPGEGINPLLIYWYAFRYTIRVLAGDQNGLVGVLTAIGVGCSVMLSLYIMVFRTADRRYDTGGVALFWWFGVGISLSVGFFSLIFVVLKAIMEFSGLMFGHFVQAAELYSTSSVLLALLFALRVRSEHATVHRLEHLLERFGVRSRRHTVEHWEDPVA